MDKWYGFGLLLVGLLAIGLISCDDDDDAAVLDVGNSTIQGTVQSFTADGVTVSFMAPEKTRGIAQGVADVLVPPALAAVEGVTVTVQGTTLSTTTAANGTFVISGVPAGSYVLVFSYQGTEITYAVDVPDNTRVELNGVALVDDGTITVVQVLAVPLVSTSNNDDDDEEEEAAAPAPTNGTIDFRIGEAP